MKLLITGGAGFIGSCFIKYILDKYPHYKVINLDLLTYAGNLNNLSEVEANSNYKFVRADICEEQLVLEYMSGLDCYINFAAESHVDNSIACSKHFVRTNVEGTRVLLECARKSKVARYIQISTDEVYGSLGESGHFTEVHGLAPNSPYSASKAAADLLVRSYFKTHKLPVIITRCSNNYGPNQHPEKLIPRAITNLLHGKPVSVYGDGLNIRDWLYVYDNCEALDKVLHAGQEGEIYNIGGECEYTNIEVVRLLVKLLHKSENLIRYVTDRPGHDRRYALDNTKIKKELEWRPVTKFEDGLQQTINWYIERPQWIESCKLSASMLG